MPERPPRPSVVTPVLDLLVREIKRAGLSHKDFARRLGLSRSQWVRIRTGYSRIKVRHLVSIVGFLRTRKTVTDRELIFAVNGLVGFAVLPQGSDESALTQAKPGRVTPPRLFDA